MEQNFKHTFITSVLTVVVLFPFALQALHALENHKHQVVCTAKDVKHFHNQEIDCSSIYHIPIEYETNLLSHLTSDQKSFEHQLLVSYKTRFTSTKISNLNLSRGPPPCSIFLVSY